jgi:hypothetical protein
MVHSIASGIHSFVLPAWSMTVQSVSGTGNGVSVIGKQSGTVSLGQQV